METAPPVERVHRLEGIGVPRKRRALWAIGRIVGNHQGSAAHTVGAGKEANADGARFAGCERAGKGIAVVRLREVARTGFGILDRDIRDDQWCVTAVAHRHALWRIWSLRILQS